MAPQTAIAAALAVAVAVFAITPVAAENMCSITQDCHSSSLDSGCTGRAEFHPPTKPNYPGLMCPQYSELACCNHYQNAYLEFNFFLIDIAFGSSNNGCDACAQNLKDLWCYFSCAPNQADFLFPIGIVNATDPETGRLTKVLHSRVDISTKYACDMYSTCKDAEKCREVATLKTCLGFLNYQGTYGAIGRGNWIKWNFTDVETALVAPMQQCNSYKLPGSNKTLSCPCSSCEKSCVNIATTGGDAAKFEELSKVHALHGADWGAVGILYGAVAIATTALVTWRVYRGRYKND